MMGDYWYGGTAGGLAYPYGVSSSSSSAPPYPSASAPPFMVDPLPPSPPGFRDFFAESVNPHIFPNPPKFSVTEFDGTTSYGSHWLHNAWPHNPEVQQTLGFHAYHGLPPSPSPSSLSYADVTGVGSCVSRGNDSYSDMFIPGDVLPSRGKHVAYSTDMAHPSENYCKEQLVDFVPAYDSVTSLPGSSSKTPESWYPQEPSFLPVEPCSYNVSSNGFHEKFSKQHCVSHATMKAVSHLPEAPEMNTPYSDGPLPMSRLERQDFSDGSQIRSRFGGGEPVQSGRSVSDNVPDNFLAAKSSLQSSCTDPINFNPLPGSDEATGRVKPWFEGPNLHSRTVDSTCWKCPGVSHSLPFTPMSSRPLQDKPEESSGSSHYQGPNLLYVDTDDDDDDAVESSLKNPTDNLRSDENRFWYQFMASASEGPSAPDLLSEKSESCDAMKVESRKAQSVVGQAACLSDDVNQPSHKGVQANVDPCTNVEQMHVEDVSSSEKKCTSGEGLGLEERRSNFNDMLNSDSSHGHSRAVGDSSSPCSSLKVDSVVKTMHNLSELLVHNCSSNRSMLKEQDLATLKEVVNNLNNCLQNTTGQMAKTGEAPIPKQALSEYSSEMVKPLEVLEAAATGVLDQNQYDAYGYIERVKNDKMAQGIKKILASNFADEKEMQPQILLFKNLWLEAEAALCSTTHMARFYRVRNEIESQKLCNTKETSSNAKLPSEQEQCPHPQESAVAMNDGEKNTEGLIPDSCVTDANSHRNNVTTTSHVPRSWDFNPDSVDALLADVLVSPSMSPPDQNIDATSEKNPDSKSLDSCIVGTSSHVIDVMDRFQILKLRDEEHQPPNNLDSEENNLQTAGMPSGDSLDNLEASVVARFHILTSRPDHFTPETLTLTVKEDAREMEDDGGVHGRGYESPLSDWEHVLGDDAPGSKHDGE